MKDNVLVNSSIIQFIFFDDFIAVSFMCLGPFVFVSR